MVYNIASDIVTRQTVWIPSNSSGEQSTYGVGLSAVEIAGRYAEKYSDSVVR